MIATKKNTKKVLRESPSAGFSCASGVFGPISIILLHAVITSIRSTNPQDRVLHSAHLHINHHVLFRKRLYPLVCNYTGRHRTIFRRFLSHDGCPTYPLACQSFFCIRRRISGPPGRASCIVALRAKTRSLRKHALTHTPGNEIPTPPSTPPTTCCLPTDTKGVYIVKSQSTACMQR